MVLATWLNSHGSIHLAFAFLALATWLNPHGSTHLALATRPWPLDLGHLAQSICLTPHGLDHIVLATWLTSHGSIHLGLDHMVLATSPDCNKVSQPSGCDTLLQALVVTRCHNQVVVTHGYKPWLLQGVTAKSL